MHLSKHGSNHHGNVEVDEIADNNSLVDIDIVVGDEAVPGPSTSGLQEVSFNMSISERKLAGTNQIISEEPNVDKLTEESPIGYRFMDKNILSNAFDAVARCPDCDNKLKLLQTKKQGISFGLIVSGTSKKKKKVRSFGINRRVYYSMRRIGNGYEGMKRFLVLMNHPSPMTEKNYRKIA